MNIQATPDRETAQPLSRVAHVDFLARQFGKVRSFALEALLHMALASIDKTMNADTGHTMAQNTDAMADLLKIIRQGSKEKNLDAELFKTILKRDGVNSDTVTDAEALLAELVAVEQNIRQDTFPTVAEIEALFETYTSLRIRISTFLRQVEALTEQWSLEDEDTASIRMKFSSTITDLESMSGAIAMLAINASVEASRAGEGGSAFGVIAQEMHRLSAQSAALLRSTRQSLSL